MVQHIEMPEPPMTLKELSDYLRLNRMTIYKMLRERTIPASRIGHQWRFIRHDIDNWITSKSIAITNDLEEMLDDSRVLFESVVHGPETAWHEWLFKRDKLVERIKNYQTPTEENGDD